MLNDPSEILEEKTSKIAILNLRKDGIMTLEPKLEETEQNIESMKIDFKILKDWAKDKKLGFLVDARRFKKFDADSRAYAQKNAPIFATKYAVIITSGMSSFLANIFLYINRPNIPTRLFTNKEDAVNWLKTTSK